MKMIAEFNLKIHLEFQLMGKKKLDFLLFIITSYNNTFKDLNFIFKI